MRTKRKPEEVFTPKTIVSREMFENRNESDIDGNPGLQDSLMDALREPGGQIVVYGDTGVGKSSLLRYAAEDEKLEAITVECISSKSYSDLLEDALRQVVTVKEISRTRTTSGEAELGGSAAMKLFVSVKGTLKGSHERSRTFAVLDQPILDALTQAMEKTRKTLLILENFQNIKSPETRHLVAQTMEALSDRAANDNGIAIVVVGIAEDVPSLVSNSGSFRRRITEIGVPRMPNEEIQAIFEKGFRLLGLNANEQALRDLVFFSDGFPFFAHLLGLHTSRWALREAKHDIDDSDLPRALSRAVASVDKSYSERLELAFELGGDIQPRKSILNLLARSDRRDWRSAEVIEAWEKEYGKREAYQFLHVALAALLDDKHGKMLTRKGSRNRYTYQFSDPYLRPYLRLKARN